MDARTILLTNPITVYLQTVERNNSGIKIMGVNYEYSILVAAAMFETEAVAFPASALNMGRSFGWRSGRAGFGIVYV